MIKLVLFSLISLTFCLVLLANQVKAGDIMREQTNTKAKTEEIEYDDSSLIKQNGREYLILSPKLINADAKAASYIKSNNIKKPAGAHQIYLKSTGSDEVYLVEGNLRVELKEGVNHQDIAIRYNLEITFFLASSNVFHGKLMPHNSLVDVYTRLKNDEDVKEVQLFVPDMKIGPS